MTLDSKLNAINNAISRLENNSTSGTPSNPSLGGNTTIITMGNYTIKYNETDDTLDFIYNDGTGGGTPEEPGTGGTTQEEVKPTWIDDVYLDPSTGIQEDNVGTACSDFISYDNSYQYKITVDTVTYIRVLYYDSSKAFISKENVEDNSTDSVLTPPSNTAYIRLKVSKESIAFADLSQHVILKKILA